MEIPTAIVPVVVNNTSNATSVVAVVAAVVSFPFVAIVTVILFLLKTVFFLLQCTVRTTSALMLGVFGACISVAWWIYYKTITEPLRLFYFVGPVWGNINSEQVCFELTGIDSGWWNKTSDRLDECHRLLNTRFHSFEVSIMCVLYFASLVFAIMYLVCRYCFLRPFVNEMRRFAGNR